MAAKVNRRFAERDPLLDFLPVDDVFQLEAITGTADSDMVAVFPSEGAGASQQAGTVQCADIEAVVVFAQSVVRKSGHINRSQFLIFSMVRR